MTTVCEIGVCVCVYGLENNNCSKCKVTKGSGLAVITKGKGKKRKKETCRQ